MQNAEVTHHSHNFRPAQCPSGSQPVCAAGS